MTYTIIGLIVIGLILYFSLRPKNKAGGSTGGYYISTQGQSEERVKDLELDQSSEDASHILDLGKLSFPKIKTETEDVDYKADPEREWIIDVIQVNGGIFKTEDLDKIFNLDWRQNFTSTIYGFSPVDHRWTFAFAGDAPEIYTKIQVAIDLQEVYNEAALPYDPEKLEVYKRELVKRISKYPTKLSIHETEPVSNAIAKAKKLIALNHEFDIEAIILLKSNSSFKGKMAWDALQSLGLNWGDGDLFHWNNEEDYGDDQHFSVWTTTDPGYFLPEDIKDGTMNPADLGFSFSVPRSADPKNIFAVMYEAVKYCQSRLGGIIVDKDGKPFDEIKEKKALDNLIEQMKKQSLVPGTEKALRMF